MGPNQGQLVFSDTMRWARGNEGRGDAQLGLLVGTAEVALQCILELLLVVLEEVPDLNDLRLAELDGLGAAGGECFACLCVNLRTGKGRLEAGTRSFPIP